MRNIRITLNKKIRAIGEILRPNIDVDSHIFFKIIHKVRWDVDSFTRDVYLPLKYKSKAISK